MGGWLIGLQPPMPFPLIRDHSPFEKKENGLDPTPDDPPIGQTKR